MPSITTATATPKPARLAVHAASVLLLLLGVMATPIQAAPAKSGTLAFSGTDSFEGGCGVSQDRADATATTGGQLGVHAEAGPALDCFFHVPAFVDAEIGWALLSAQHAAKGSTTYTAILTFDAFELQAEESATGQGYGEVRIRMYAYTPGVVCRSNGPPCSAGLEHVYGLSSPTPANLTMSVTWSGSAKSPTAIVVYMEASAASVSSLPIGPVAKANVQANVALTYKQ